MNHQNYNTQSMPKSNVGLGWSTNYDTQNLNAPIEMSKNLGPPPPIGFIIPNSNPSGHQDIQKNSYSDSFGPSGQTNQNYLPENQGNLHQSSHSTLNTLNYDPMNVYSLQNKTQKSQDHKEFKSEQKNQLNLTQSAQKSNYQKGLDQLADLMKDDIDVTPAVIKEQTNKYDLSK